MSQLSRPSFLLSYWVPGHSNVLANFRADELLPELVHSFRKRNLIELGMPFASFKLAIARKFFCDANLSWVNDESCFTTRLIWLLMDRRRTNQLLGRAYRLLRYGQTREKNAALQFNDFCRGCRSAEEEETVIHFSARPLLDAGTDCLAVRSSST